MKLPRAILLFIWLVAGSVSGQTNHVGVVAVRFQSIDLFVDSGTRPLAAYQLEFRATAGVVKIVGIEGGDHAAFAKPPVYDPRAMQHERVMLAAFNTAREVGLPKGKTRVATVHVQVSGDAKPEYAVTLTTAGTEGGGKIQAQVSMKEKGNQ